MPEVVVEDKSGKTQPLGGNGRGRHRRDRLEPTYEMVRPADGVIAERFDAPHRLQPRLAGAGATALHAKSKRKRLAIRHPSLRFFVSNASCAHCWRSSHDRE